MGNTVSNQFYRNCQNMNYQNIIDINGAIQCATNLRGLPSNSASPSDLLRFQFPSVPQSHYNGEIINGGFQKIFISNLEQLNIDFPVYVRPNSIVTLTTNALYYEYYVYMEKIRNLLEKNVNPHFIKVLGGVRDTPFENLFRYM